MSNYSELKAIAEQLVKGPSVRRSLPAGYDVKPKERCLMVVNNFYEREVVDAISEAIRGQGATVDVITLDLGPDRPLNYKDEFLGFIHNWRDVPEVNPVRSEIERAFWTEEVAAKQGYDLMIHTLGGPVPETNYRYEGIPWYGVEIFPAAAFPYEVWNAVNQKAWDMVWKKGRGGKVRLTDPEGTDVSFTLHEGYYNIERYKPTNSIPFFQEKPFFGHLFGRQTPPLVLDWEDVSGVVAGTINHCSSPFPHIKVHLDGWSAKAIEGGGQYGQLWREILEDTKNIQYPEFPEPGLFGWWELAIGTNPKMKRPSNFNKLSGAGTVYERLRSGIIHIGIGSAIYGPSEVWAAQQRLPYGHLHVHPMFATYELTCKDGSKVKLIDHGHLTALDDPEVREIAKKYGNPDEILKEEWVPPVPGITEPGDYWADYANDPAGYCEKYYAALKK